VKNTLYGRVILSHHVGATLTGTLRDSEELPPGVRILCNADLETNLFLAPPFESIPVLPEEASYRGEMIGVVTGPDWRTADSVAMTIKQAGGPDRDADTGAGQPLRGGGTEIDGPIRDQSGEATGADGAYEIVEGIYQTGVQLHMADAPLWAEATPTGKGVHITVPCQWPAHVRQSVATALRVPVRAVHLACETPSGNRDGAIVVPALLAIIAAVTAITQGETARIALRRDQGFVSGGRAPARIQWASRLGEDGTVLSNSLRVEMKLGAHAILKDEIRDRLRIAATSFYEPGPVEHEAKLVISPNLPMGAFEGVASAPISFAREVHWNRLAEIAQEDPIEWRRRHLRTEWPVMVELCKTLAAESDFHRRYSANELIRKRRVQLPWDSAALRGIGCALSEQQCGMTSARETGAVTVRLNADGTAHLYCSVPTPTARLQAAWHPFVAQDLGIERDQVLLETGFDSNLHDSGPRLFSRGVTLVPRAIASACQAIQKQRFREPLPITVRRTMRGGHGTRTPVDALQSVGGTAVEAVLRPARMEIDVRSVTMAIYAGRILDRGMAEAELRRGIYHALNWTLHESLLDLSRVADRETLRSYNTAFRGPVPRIKIVFLNQLRRDGPVGIGELPFNTVPAALVSALSQASGLYLDSLPVQPAHILRLFQDE
jgi:CO/xanthine dehydrogenase Mo-binding subunit